MRIEITHNANEVRAQIAKGPPSVMAAVDRKLGRGAQEVARDARRNAAKAFSTLTHAINVFRRGEADYEVFAGAEYARYVEEGTGPGGWPRRQTLEDWIKVKRITPADSDIDLEDLVFLIGRKIHAEGTPAQPFMRPALEAKRDRLAELMRQGVAEGLRAAR